MAHDIRTPQQGMLFEVSLSDYAAETVTLICLTMLGLDAALIVNVVLPAATPLMLPSASTVAIESSSIAKKAFWLEPVGAMVASTAAVPPTVVVTSVAVIDSGVLTSFPMTMVSMVSSAMVKEKSPFALASPMPEPGTMSHKLHMPWKNVPSG